MRFQRWIQTVCLFVFLGLILLAAWDWAYTRSLDFFLRLDPSIALITTLSNRHFLFRLFPAVIMILLTLLLGRVFCGHICPMGTTLDVTDKIFGTSVEKQSRSGTLRPVKYLVLIGLAAAAIPGISYVFLASPLSLITRFYGLVILPIVNRLTSATHQLLFPLWELMDNNSLLFLQFDTRRYATQFFVLGFFVVLFALSRLTPRFWCRYLCPAGAIFALCSRKPLVRRVVSNHCTLCGDCLNACPMDAIDPDDPSLTRFDECIVCLACEKTCPETAISFHWKAPADQSMTADSLPSRRRFIIAGVTGVGSAMLGMTGLQTSLGKTGEGQVAPPRLIRPPATLPEAEFLSRCIRCGECMLACPTNTLQPLWFEAGLTGLFSPAMIPRRGYCNPDCHRCAEVCPTHSIRRIPKSERIWAKTGTAVIERQKCLAWEFDHKCMVCDEVCPFGAIQFSREPELSVSVPRVNEDRCSGCGYCEYHCPVQNTPAIVVTPMNALRLTEGSFQTAGEKAGFRISRKTVEPKGYPGNSNPGSPAPGFDL